MIIITTEFLVVDVHIQLARVGLFHCLTDKLDFRFAPSDAGR